ncbi:phage major capsid protein [Agromyces tardus]|uniref:phage major capsid protein n=1 Tax=Agromyces tardus TaxID=2583849 RepID=UPI00148572F5|nr:phage major capsid protein [Agromyces tardus]
MTQHMSDYRKKLIELRDSAWSDAKAILDRAQNEKRDLTSSEEAHYRDLTGDLESLRERINMVDERQRTDKTSERAMTSLLGGSSGRHVESEVGEKFRESILQRSLAPIEITIPDNERRSGFQPGIEQRALITTSGSGLVGNFWSRIQRHLVESSSILAAGATVIQHDNGEPVKIPKSTAFSTAGIVTEGSIIPTSDPTLGSITLGSYKYGFLVQISQELAEDAAFDLEGFLAEQSGVAIGNGFGAHAITGTGTGQPRGVLTDATLGVTGPTGTATSFGAQTTAGQGGDLLIDLAGSLAEPYARSQSAAWLMRNSTLNAIKKLRDSTGNYVFSPEVIPGSGSSGTLLGRPVYTDPTMPAMAANAKSVVFGDISRYWVRQVNGLRFERSSDFAFDKDLITFRGLARLDGALVDTTGAVKYFQHSAT